VAEQRYQAVLAVISDGWSISQVAQKVGVSRQTLHSWLARYEAEGLEGLVDRSHRPVSCPHQMPAAVEAAVLELRRSRPYWGPRRLVFELDKRTVRPVSGNDTRAVSGSGPPSSRAPRAPIAPDCWRCEARIRGDTYRTRVPAIAGRGSLSARRSLAQQECGQRLSGSCRGDDQRVVPVGDGRPGLRLDIGRRREGPCEPLPGQRAERVSGSWVELT
jgi:transposase-like protein